MYLSISEEERMWEFIAIKKKPQRVKIKGRFEWKVRADDLVLDGSN